MRETVKLLLLDTEENYREEYLKTFVGVDDAFHLEGIKVIFSEEDFNHIFTEPTRGSKKREFSKRRGKKMFFMKKLLEESFPKEIMFEPSTKNLAIFSLELEAVMYLVPMPKTKTLRVATFFDFGRDHTRMYKKQKRKCVPIAKKEIKRLLFLG